MVQPIHESCLMRSKIALTLISICTSQHGRPNVCKWQTITYSENLRSFPGWSYWFSNKLSWFCITLTSRFSLGSEHIQTPKMRTFKPIYIPAGSRSMHSGSQVELLVQGDQDENGYNFWCACQMTTSMEQYKWYGDNDDVTDHKGTMYCTK